MVDPLGELKLEPSDELTFRAPFDTLVSLTIGNPTLKRIAYKILTTDQQRFTATPNSGLLDPEQNLQINSNLHYI